MRRPNDRWQGDAWKVTPVSSPPWLRPHDETMRAGARGVMEALVFVAIRPIEKSTGRLVSATNGGFLTPSDQSGDLFTAGRTDSYNPLTAAILEGFNLRNRSAQSFALSLSHLREVGKCGG